MSKYIQPFIIVLLLITSIYLGVSLYICKHKELPKMTSSIKLDSELVIPPTNIYRDSEGVEHVVISDKINSIIEKEVNKQAKELAPVIEQVANNLGIKPSNVISSTTISSESSRDSVAFLKKQLENAQRLTFFYKDKYLTLNVNTNPKDTSDLGSFGYKYNADLNITQYSKKNWFLGRKNSYSDISLNDPNATVMGVKKFTVKQKEPAYGLRIQASAVSALDFRKGNQLIRSVSVGPTLRIDAGRFSLRGTYYYNNTTKVWNPTLGIDYDLTRF